MRKFLVGLSLYLILICFPGPMMAVLHLLTMSELFARLNAQYVYPVAGILWFYTMVVIATSYWKSRPEEDRIWVVDERYLDQCDGIPYYTDVQLEPGVWERQIDLAQNPIIVREVRK